MNLLNGSKCYTIGNLEYDSFSFAKDWRDFVKNELSSLGIKILSPLDKVFANFEKEGEGYNKYLKEQLSLGNYDLVHSKMSEVRNRDLAMCDLSTFIIGVLNPNIPTYGTVDEIITSKRNRKPVFLVIPDAGYSKLPLWLCSYFKPDWVYSNLNDVITRIKEIDSGKIEVNNKYWKILEKNYQ